MKRLDELPVWSLVCLFIHKDHRGQGMAAGMIAAAMDYAERGLIAPPYLFAFVLGQTGALPATPKNLLFLSESIPNDAHWCVAGHGGHAELVRRELDLAALPRLQVDCLHRYRLAVDDQLRDAAAGDALDVRSADAPILFIPLDGKILVLKVWTKDCVFDGQHHVGRGAFLCGHRRPVAWQRDHAG